jgi:Rrf2 family protein
MLVTRKIDYGLRLMLTLGCRPEQRLTSVKLAKLIEVPRQFALKIAQILTKAGLIKAQRGVGGGLELARPSSTITLFDIMQAADTPRALNGCLLNPAICTRAPHCAAHQELGRIQDILNRELKTVTLADLISQQKIIDQEAKQRRLLAAEQDSP